MKEKLKAFTRPSGKKTDFILTVMILGMVLIYGGGLIGILTDIIIPYRAILSLMTPSEDIFGFAQIYTGFVGVWILFFILCWIIKYDRPLIGKLKINKKSLKGALIGVLLGFSMNGICILISALSGKIKLYFNEINPGLIIFFIIIICIQSGAEEIVDRIYIYQKLRRRYKSPLVAIAGNALFFAALHIFNPGATLFSFISIAVIAVFYSLIIYYYDCVWVAIMAHTLWNYTQNIIFGLPNSGLVSRYSIFKLDAASATDGLFYSVNFGVEESFGAILVNLIGIIVILLINRGKKEKNDIGSDT